MVMTASLCSATSSGVATSLAPASISALALSAVRFHTVTLWPTSISRAAIAAPMRPSPAIPICIGASPCVLLRRARERRALVGGIMNAASATGQAGKTIGIVGLGIMGGAIAKNLADAGWQVIGFDIDATRCAEAKAAGVTIATGAAE